MFNRNTGFGILLAFLVIFFPTFSAAEDGLQYDFQPRVVFVGLGSSFLTFPNDMDQMEYDHSIIDGAIGSFLRPFSPRQIRRVFPGFNPENYAEYDDIPPLDRFFALTFDRDLDIPDLADSLSQFRGVLFAEPSYFAVHQDSLEIIRQGDSGAISPPDKGGPLFPNDPVFGAPSGVNQWNLQDDGIGIGCPTAWAFTKGDPEIRIGVLDYGIWQGHGDLVISGGLRVANGMGQGPAVVQLQVLEDEKTQHGTSCAGIVGAITNNEYAVAGIAGGNFPEPGCSLYELQIEQIALDEQKMDYWALAIESAADPLGDVKCNVISMSLGTLKPGNGGDPSNLLQGAIQFANAVGVNVVSGSGRKGSQLPYPGLFPDHLVTVVGACTTDGTVFSDSGRGGEIDLVAPGDAVPTTTNPFHANPVFGEANLNYFSYTSCAIPHVAGSIGLLRSFLGNSFLGNYLSPFDYENILKLSASDENRDSNSQTWDSDYGHGRLNIGEALTNVSNWEILSFSTGNTYISEPEEVTIRFISGPFAGGEHDALRYKVSGDISFSSAFTGIPKVWGLSSPPYLFGFHGLSDYSPNFCETFHGVEEASVTISGCTAYTYTYKIADNNGAYKYWYPAHYSQIPVGVKAMGETKNTLKQKLEVKEVGLEMGMAPNPFNSLMEISLILASQGNLTIDIVDVRGRTVCSLVNGVCESNRINVTWNGLDQEGRAVPSGIYFVRAVTDVSTLVKKITLAK